MEERNQFNELTPNERISFSLFPSLSFFPLPSSVSLFFVRSKAMRTATVLYRSETQLDSGPRGYPFIAI